MGYLNLDVKQFFMLDINTARHCLGLWVLATVGAVDLARGPFGNVTLTDAHPAVGVSSRGFAAHVYPELQLGLLLALLLVSRPVCSRLHIKNVGPGPNCSCMHFDSMGHRKKNKPMGQQTVMQLVPL